ncbi:hypothetical protein K461DRAFT_274826 [Myriangium duriaei CBS 260.36]|uniref:Uncharacterized protein n=1 Tax=Myriangium duriaei CBS 260.36 TaxID=1168546 RepID=A0A9P4J809_9PEZI|nr:hypothetical protein K461DRAFT_274826 [Myriangium duriaei CBS 260.36]
MPTRACARCTINRRGRHTNDARSFAAADASFALMRLATTVVVVAIASFFRATRPPR